MSGRTLIIGADGNMGRRYRAIFDHIGKGYICADINHTLEKIDRLAEVASSILIATPTSTHCSFIKALAHLRKPILCEKPISKDAGETVEALREVSKYRTPFDMIYQYKMLPQGAKGVTMYDYYRHGSDGLVWDCIQIVGLAKSDLLLKEVSPVWTCKLNGKKQSLGDMDQAYVDFIEAWFEKPGQDVSWLRDVHAKTFEIDRSYHARPH